MSDTQKNQKEERRGILLITISLVLTIATFMAFSSVPTLVDNGVVTTQVISMRPGDVNIERSIAAPMLVKISPEKNLQKIFKP